MQIKFTIVTVTYNAEDSIKRTIESVLNQTFMPYEYIIIDGNSTDETLNIAKKYQTLFQEKGIIYKMKSEDDKGIYNAMNKGIDAATGDFLSFLNAGDWYELDALQNYNKLYNQESFDLSYGGLHYINPNGTITTKMSKNDTVWVTSRHWNHPSMVLKSDIYKKYHFDEKYRLYADFELYLKLRNSNTKIKVMDKVIANFVADGVSTDTSFKSVLIRAKEKYAAYIKNGYEKIYWIESYGWEIFKALYFKIRS